MLKRLELFDFKMNEILNAHFIKGGVTDPDEDEDFDGSPRK